MAGMGRIVKTGTRVRASVVQLAAAALVASSLVGQPVAASAAPSPPGTAGALDPTFGTNGVATVAVAGLNLTQLTKVLFQADGKIVVGGIQPGTVGSVVVARLTAAGVLDTSFGAGRGYVRPGFGSRSTQDGAGIALQPDGKIVVVGSKDNGSDADESTTTRNDPDADDGTQVGVSRLNPDGSLDSTFGTAGIVTTDLDASSGLHGTAAAVSPDGHLLVSAFTGAGGNFAVVRYTSTGQIDTTFGASGAAYASPASPSTATSAASDLTLQSDGRIVLAGSASVDGQNDTAVVRFNPNGTLDTTFNDGRGFVTFDASRGSTADSAVAVAIDPAGRIVLSGTVAGVTFSSSSSRPAGRASRAAAGSAAAGSRAATTGSGPYAYTLRLLATGTRDTTFASNGELEGTFGGTGGTATGGSLAFDGSGRALVAGGDSANALGIERLLDGASPYDGSFGAAASPGRETIECSPAGPGGGTGVAVQPDQRLLVGGNCNGSLVVARLTTGNITNLTMIATSPTATAGHPAIGLSSIPPGVLVPNAGALGSSALRSSAIFGSPFGGGPFGGGPFGGGPFGGGPFGGGPFGGGPFGGGPFGGGPLEGGAFLSPNLPSITISTIPLLPSASWPQVLAGTSCASIAPQSLTLQYVFANCNTAAVQGLFSGQININATPLRNASLIGFALGLTPASSFPSFCPAVAALVANCTNTDPTKASLVDFELKGDNLASYYAGTPINLNGLTLVSSPLTVTWLGAMQLTDTTLGQVLISSLTTPGKFVTCAPNCAAGETLALAQANNQLQQNTGNSLGALLADSPAAVGPLPLQNLMIAMVPRQALPVEQISLGDIVANSPLPATGSAGYQVDFDLSCGAASGLAVLPQLAPGFRLIASSVAMTVGGTATPVTVGNDRAIRPQAPVSCPGTAGPTRHVTTTLRAEPVAVLGPTTAGVSVTTASDSVSATGQAPVDVVDGTDESPSGTTTPPATPVTADTLYLGHIATPGDIDYFSLAPPPVGSVVSVTLSHLPADYDLVMYGKETPSLRAAPFGGGPFGGGPFGGGPFGGGPFGGGPFGGGPLVTDNSTLPTSNGSTTPPEVLQDVPLLASPVRAASAQRGNTDEAVYTVTTEVDTTPLIIQVSGFNGASSAQPYVMRVNLTPPRPALPCAPVTMSGGAKGSLPATIDPATRTLILVNQKRLGDIYGPALAAQTITKLNVLAAYKDPNGNHANDVNGLVVPVDGDPTVARAYQAWDATPCSVKAANQVVTDINALVDRLRAAVSDFRYLTIAGSDLIMPFGRVPDGSALLNEREFGPGAATRGTDNAQSAALSAGYLLSDNPYGDLSPSSPDSSPLYVPQVAVGRLVETPADIAASVDQYIATNGVRTPNAVFGTGYDWMQSAGQSVQASLTPRVPGGTSNFLLSNTWTRADALSGLAGAAHGYVSLNAHSDFSRALPASEFISATHNPDLITTADLPADVSGSVFFTLGCHSGLNVSDTYIANPTAGEKAALNDWPQAISHNGGTLQAPTGYGIGDSEALAYSARLLASFAQNLDGTMSVGQALMFAKQQYFKIGVASVYDAKAVEEATFYGLPMYRLGATGDVAAATIPPPTPTQPATVSVATAPSTFNTTPTQAAGTHFYAVGNQAPQVTPNEPVEPRTDIALAKRPDGLVAHGDVIEALTSLDVNGFTPTYDTPVADLTALSKRPLVVTAAFPSRLQTIATTVGPNGPQQSLVLVPGQFSSDSSGTGTGRQRLYSNIASTVWYSNSTSFVPPTISTVKGSVSGSTATFTVTTPTTDVKRGVLLFLPAGGPTAHAWQHVELVNAGGRTWIASVAVPAGVTSVGEFFVQLVDSSGNVAVSSNKADNYSASLQNSTFTFSISPSPDPVTGLYPIPVTVTVTGPAGQNFTVVADGGAPQTFTGSGTVTLTTDGAHTIVAQGPGGVTATATVPIDSSPPAIVATTPVSGASFRPGQSVPSHFTCSSNLTLLSCNGLAFVDTSTPGPHTFVITATDIFGRTSAVSVPYTVDGTPPVVTFSQTPPAVTGQTSATFVFSASDPDSPGVSFTCSLDAAAATPCTSPATANVAVGPHSFTVTATDEAGNSGSALFRWRVDIPTSVVAEGVIQGIPKLNARLTANGSPVAGQKLNFTFGRQGGGGRQVVCSGSADGTATTGADGVATCNVTVVDLLAVVVSLGYTASFAGNPPYLPSQGSAGIL